MGNPCCHLPYEFKKICQCGGLKPLYRQISLHTTTILFHRLELSVGREHRRRRKSLEVGLLKRVNCAVNYPIMFLCLVTIVDFQRLCAEPFTLQHFIITDRFDVSVSRVPHACRLYDTQIKCENGDAALSSFKLQH